MRQKLILFLTGLSCMLLLGISACEDEPTAEEKFLEKIGKAWTADVVKLEDVVLEGAFDGFTITFTTDQKFTTANGNNPIWAPSGSFTLKAANTTAGFNLVRNDGVEVKVTELTDTNLVLELHYISTGGRTSSVTGDYVFELSN